LNLFSKYIFSFFVLLAYQNLQCQVTSIYGNLNWIEDSVESLGKEQSSGFSSLSFGDKVFSEGFVQMLEKDSIEDDSSTFSRVIYELGGKANQRLTAVLSRPIKDNQRLFLYFDRHAYPGWMLRSFSRGTKIGGDYSIQDLKGFDVSVSVDGVITDNEMNGGLSGLEYSISESQGQRDFGSVTSDIFLNEAYWRNTFFHSDFKISREVPLKNRSSINFGLYGTYLRQKFLYNDEDPDSTFYAEYIGDTIDVPFRDSIRSNELSTSLFVGFSNQIDSTRLISSTTSFDIDNVNYFSNSLRRSFVNFSLRQELDLSGEHFNVNVSGAYFLSGFNSGDIHVASKLVIGSNTDQSNIYGLRAELKGSYSLVEPIMVFQYYENSLGQNVVDYNKTSSIRGRVSLSNGFRKGNVNLSLEYESLINAVYFQSDFSSKQYSETIQLLTPSLSYKYEGKVVKSHSRVLYQISSQDSIYSLPEWVLQSNVAFKFRLFKKKVGIEMGVDAWYFSDYYARGYLPMVNHMFIQSSNKYGNYLQVDPFAMARIQRVDISLAYVNATYGLINDDPIIAPGYPILPRYLKIVIDWNFKN